MTTHYTFDIYGRFAGTSDTATERSTTVAPAAETQDYNWNGVSWVFAPNVLVVPVIAPAPAPAAIEPRHITQLAFLNRFTDAEAIAIDLASQGATVEAAAMRRYQAKVSAATFIDLDREDTRAGVEALEAVGLLPEGRAAEILDAAVADGERWRG